MQHILENLALGRSLYQRLLEPVARNHGLTSMELNVLLFLANNPQYKTAKDLVEVRQIAKSHASLAISGLEEKGYLEKQVVEKDRRAYILQLLPSAFPIVEEGRNAQNQFGSVMKEGLTEEELQTMKGILQKMNQNIKDYQEK